MNYKHFKNSNSGRLIPTIHGASAFVPNPLPPKFDMGAIAIPMATAMGALGELKGACRRLSNPYVMMRPLQRSEALTSSAMEGTYTTDDELILAESGIQKTPSDETREVANYIQALSFALDKVTDAPITNRLLKNAHKILLSNLGKDRGANKLPGEFKRDQNMIGGRTLDTARYIPPPPRETLDCMSDLEKYINRPNQIDSCPLIDMALTHYQIEAIHPFADGNGRIGRMLISLLAVNTGLLEVPALYLSPVIERNKDEYIDRMYAVSVRAEWENWLIFFFDTVATSCRETVQTIDRVIRLHENYRQIAQDAVQSTNILSIIDMLFENPAVRVRDVVDHIGISDVAARKLLARLVDLEIVVEFDKVYPKAFLAFGLIAAARPQQI